MESFTIPLSWTNVYSFILYCYNFLENIRFSLPGGGSFSLFDCILYSAIMGGVATIIVTFISGGQLHD